VGLSVLGLLTCLAFFIFSYWDQGNFEDLLKDPTADMNRLEGVVFVLFLALSPGVISSVGTVVMIFMGLNLKKCLILYYSLIFTHVILYFFIQPGNGAQASLYVLVAPVSSCLIQVVVFLFLISVSVQKSTKTLHH